MVREPEAAGTGDTGRGAVRGHRRGQCPLGSREISGDWCLMGAFSQSLFTQSILQKLDIVFITEPVIQNTINVCAFPR